MTSALRILHLEDNLADAELIQAALESDGILVDVTRVETQADFVRALGQPFDVILADNTLPTFDGLSALALARHACPDVPFIFVSGTLGEEVAVDALKIRATDYVLKERLSRIGASVQRALREARERSERARAEAVLADEKRAHLWFLESMDRINRAIQSTNDLEQMMSNVLAAALSIFGCDRAWLVYPCDPDARAWRVPMEHTRPEFPGAGAQRVEVPIDPETAAAFTLLRASMTPVRFGAGAEHALPNNAAQRFGIQSMMAMAIYPKGDRPYSLGLHQCSFPRAWTPPEARLFQEIGGRLEDALTGMLIVRGLRESERRLEEAQRISHVGYWEREADTNRSIWSDETWRILGLSPQPRSVELREVLDRVHPADRERREAAIAAAVQGGARYDIEYRMVRPTGEVRFVRSQGDVFRDASGQPRSLFGTLQDITERKIAEHRLLAQHAVTQALAAAATLEEATPRILRAIGECLDWDVGALWRLDAKAAVLRCVEIWHTATIAIPNFEAATRATTFAAGKGLPGRVWATREPVYVADVVRDPEFARAPVAEREALHAGFGVPILLGGDVLGVMEFFSHEIRPSDPELLAVMAGIGSQIGQFIERKRAEEALAHARADLAHVGRVTTVGEMSASIAHEINQPLAAMANNATACLQWLDGDNVGQARESAAMIIDDAHRAGEIIGRIRALVRKHPPRRERVDINAIILEVIALVRYDVQRHGVSVRTELDERLPLVLADRIQLQQVLLNLMMNAIEAMSAGAETPREVSITSMTDADAVAISVADTGPGLSPATRERLFEAFHTTKPHGMGMGLAISRSIVDAHGGRLWATDTEPRGAVFQLRLPIGFGSA